MTDSALPVPSSVRSGDAWWKGAVVYQIYPRSFMDANGDGIGDLQGIISRLDYLRDLGVDALWICPICRSPQADNGYDISDYEDIDPLFGSRVDYDQLIAEAHARGIRIIMDLVLNHTSVEHPWFVESRSSVDNPKRDWYIWRPGSEGAEPNNWAALWGGSAWTLDSATDQYYLHIFNEAQPDLNWDNPDVRAALFAMINRWLDRGVDGFRLDAVNFISKHPDLPDGFILAGERYGFSLPFFVDGPHAHEYMHELNRAITPGRPRLVTVGEMGGVTTENAALYTDESREELDMVFGFDHLLIDQSRLGIGNDDFQLPELKAVFNEWQTALADRGWNSLFWNNHDQPRVVSRFGDDGEHRVRSAKMLAAVLHLMKGTPYIYQGEELGMTNFPWTSLDQFLDIELKDRLAEARARGEVTDEEFFAGTARYSRDNARTPMQWDASANAGFSAATPWLDVNPNASEINAAAQIDDPDSVFAFYRRLIDMRHDMPIIVYGEFELLLADHPQLFAYTRRLDDASLLVLANFSGESVDIPGGTLDEFAGSDVLLGNVESADQTMLAPWEVRVYGQS